MSALDEQSIARNIVFTPVQIEHDDVIATSIHR